MPIDDTTRTLFKLDMAKTQEALRQVANLPAPTVLEQAAESAAVFCDTLTGISKEVNHRPAVW